MSLSRSIMSAIRFGYGIRPGEPVPSGPEDLLAQVKAGIEETPRFPREGIEGRRDTILQHRLNVSKLPVQREIRREAVRPLRRALFFACGHDQHARVAQSVFSPYGFFERLATFWTDHFSVSVRKQQMMYLYVPLYEAEVIRKRLGGRFADLLREATIHPAMLIYLDQVKSIGPNSRRGSEEGKGLNENLGRELLELHTVGIESGYTQADVRAAALALTGFDDDKETARTRFRPNIAEPGPIEIPFLKRSYAEPERRFGDIDALFDDLAVHPDTAQHICRKLAIHFVADEPPVSLVNAMVDAWMASGGMLSDVYAAMLHHPAAWQEPGRKVRQPYDYVVTGLRAVGLPESEFALAEHISKEDGAAVDMMMAMPEMAGKELRIDPKMRQKIRPVANPLTVGAIKELGQPIWEPSSPEGTEEEFSTWVSSSQLTGRIEWAQRIADKRSADIEPLELAKAVLLDAARPETLRVISQAPSRHAALSLLLSSPEFNRR